MALAAKRSLATVLCAISVIAGTGLGTGSAFADPDQSPSDPAVLNAPPVDGRYQASDGDLVTLALRQGVRQRSGVYQFLWQPAR